MILRLLARYQAVIFDLDGTLTDSMRVWDNVCRDWLSAKGATPDDTLERDIERMTLTQSAEYIIRRYNLPASPSQVLRDWENMVLHQYEHTVPLKDGAAELVEALAAAGVKLGIATSCFPAACESVLLRYGLRKYFSAIVYSDHVNRDKTFPDVYLAVAERLGVKPDLCAVFEDFPAAARGVKSAGMGLAAVYDDSSKEHWESFKKEADFAVVSLREVFADPYL